MAVRLSSWRKRLHASEWGRDVERELTTSRLVTAAVVLGLTLVLAIELFLPIERASLFEGVVRLADASLALGFLGWVLVELVRRRAHLREALRDHRTNIVAALVVTVLIFVVEARVSGPLVVGRVLFLAFNALLVTPLGERIARVATKNPSRTTALSFAGLIGVGTGLLMTPAATTDGRGTPFVDALFTMTSAVCVTGLSVQDTGTYFSTFGQVVILLGVQAGAIGIMSLSATFIVVVGGHVPGHRQVGLSELLEVRAGLTLRRIVAAVSGSALLVELCGVCTLYFLWAVGWLELPSRYDDAANALWWSLFYGVNAFCNAGFSLSSDSLAAFVASPVVCGVFMLLITLGGLGFVVLADLAQVRPWLRRPLWSWNRLQLQTRVVLLMTLLLNVVGTLGFLFFEFAGALAPYELGVKVNAAAFQAVTLRTAGFSTVPLGVLAGPTILMMVVWMFIGGGPGSTAGGIKTTTAVTVFFAVRAMITRRDDVEVFGRTLPKDITYRAISIVMIAGAMLAFFVIALAATQREIALEHLLFEAVSAMGTVGLTMDTTTRLDEGGRLLLALLMFCGRLGPLTVALAVGERSAGRGYSYPEGRLAVG